MKPWPGVVCIVTILLLLPAIVLTGCGNNKAAEETKTTTEAETAAAGASRTITEAKNMIQSALTYGVSASDLTTAQGKLAEAESVLGNDPQRAKELALEANKMATDAKTAAKNNALALVDQAIQQAEGSIAAVTNGADLTKANSLLADAKKLKGSATTLAGLIGESNSALSSAQQAYAEAEAAYAAKEQAKAAAAGRSMTLAEYNQIRNGMTYEQVVSIVGDTGVNGRGLPGYDDTLPAYAEGYSFLGNAQGAGASVVFVDGVVIGKYQENLQ